MTIPALAPAARGPVVTPTADPAKAILTAGPGLAPVGGEVLPMADLAKTILMAGPALALALARAVGEVGVIPMGVLAARTIHTADLEPVPAPAAGRVAAPTADPAKTTHMADLAPVARQVEALMADPAPALVAGAAGGILMAGPAKMIRTGDPALVDGAGGTPAGSAGAMTASGTLEIHQAARDEARAVEREVGGREAASEAMIPMADRETRGVKDKMIPMVLEGDLAVDRMIRTAGNSTEQRRGLGKIPSAL